MMEERSSRVGKQYILETAEQLFTERGFRATSIRDIAQACGVTNAALYYHFPDKEAMFAEVMNRHAQRISERMEAAAQSADSPRQQVAAILLEYTRIVQGQNSPFFMLRRDTSLNKAQMHVRMDHLMRTIIDPVRQVLDEAIQAGMLQSPVDSADAAAMMIGMLHGLAQRRRACQTCDTPILTETDVNLVVDIFWKGLAS
jgi:AcrR family transcriptional regulator